MDSAYVNFIKLVVNWTDNFRVFVMKIRNCGRSMRKSLSHVEQHHGFKAREQARPRENDDRWKRREEFFDELFDDLNGGHKRSPCRSL
jgi:hypothetical protein